LATSLTANVRRKSSKPTSNARRVLNTSGVALPVANKGKMRPGRPHRISFDEEPGPSSCQQPAMSSVTATSTRQPLATIQESHLVTDKRSTRQAPRTLHISI
jgi:hypothetical protein